VICRGCCTNGTEVRAGSFYNIDLLGFRLALAWSDIGSLASIVPCNVETYSWAFHVASAILSTLDANIRLRHFRDEDDGHRRRDG
jgi:hypothetical protein